jgi:hypothetical protein
MQTIPNILLLMSSSTHSDWPHIKFPKPSTNVLRQLHVHHPSLSNEISAVKPLSKNQEPIRYSRISTQLIETEGSLPSSHQSTPFSHSNSLRTILILSFRLCIGLPSSPLTFRRHHHHHHHHRLHVICLTTGP